MLRLNFSRSAWRITSFAQSGTNGKAPYDLDKFPLAYRRQDKAKYLQLAPDNGGLLTIPCIEFFQRTYGSSSNFREDLLKNRVDFEQFRLGYIYDIGNFSIKGIKLSGYTHRDYIPIAHALTSDITLKRLRSIYSQLVTAPQNEKFIPLSVEPWHEGRVSLEVEGIETTGGNFLGLRIIDISDPEGPDILIEAPPGNRVGGTTGESILVARKTVIRPNIPLESGILPSPGAPIVKIDGAASSGESFRRNVDKIYSGDPKEFARLHSKGESPKSASPGDSDGLKGDVGSAHIVDPEKNLIDDAPAVLWSALLSLTERRPSEFRDLRWLSASGTSHKTREPKLADLYTKYNAQKDAPKILDNGRMRPKGFLIAELTLRMHRVYFIELERKEPGSTARQDSMSGLAYLPRKDATSHEWLLEFFRIVIDNGGKPASASGRLSGISVTYSHKRSKSVRYQGENWVRLALSKLTINIDF